VHIVITRPKEDSSNLIEKLIKLGHSVTHLPVIKIEKLETKKINLENYKAVIFTSSNAIRFMNIEKFDLKIKCFCVGNTTEFTAKQAGFINTYSSEGTVDSLIELIIRTLDTKSGKLLYLSSEFISKEIYFKHGIYRSFISKYKARNNGKMPTQIVFYDEIRRGNSIKKVDININPKLKPVD